MLYILHLLVAMFLNLGNSIFSLTIRLGLTSPDCLNVLSKEILLTVGLSQELVYRYSSNIESLWDNFAT